MFNLRNRMLVCLLLTSCVPERKLSEPSQKEENPVIEIDFESGTAVAPSWRSKIVDCSTDQDYCYELPGRMLLAFPKSCRALERRIAEIRLPRGFSIVGFDPHRSLPDASYVSKEYPNVLLFYDKEMGFTEARILNGTFDETFDPNRYQEIFTLKRVDGKDLLLCS
jgi:hypothetical protein